MPDLENKMSKMGFGKSQPTKLAWKTSPMSKMGFDEEQSKPAMHNNGGKFNPPAGPNPFGENDFVKKDERGNRFVPVGVGPKQAKQMFHPMAKISNVNKNEQGEFTYDLDPDGSGKNISSYVYGPGGKYHYNKTLQDKVSAQNQQIMKDGRWRG